MNFIKNFIREYWILTGIVLLSIYICVSSYIMPGDDGFMTLRLADNFADNFEFAYNKGEAIFGTTPLYTVLVGLLCRFLHLKAISVAFSFGLFFHIISLVILFKLAFHLTQSKFLANFAAFLLATSFAEVISTVYCMETSLFLVTLMSSFYCSLFDSKKHRILTGCLCGISFLTRPEGIFCIMAIVTERILRQKKLPKLEIIGFLTCALPWIIFATFKFGSFIPCSVKAKSLAYVRNNLEGINDLMTYSCFFFSKIFSPTDSHLIKYNFALSIIILCFVFIYGFLSLSNKDPKINVFFYFYFFFMFAYLVANPFIFIWYTVPLELIYILGLILGLKRLFFGSKQQLRQTIYYTIIVYLFVFSFLQFEYRRSNQEANFLSVVWNDQWSYESFPKKQLSFNNRESLYIKIAKEYDPKINEKTVVLAPEFGAFGYYSKAKIISSLGHVNPEVLKYLPPKNEEYVINSAIPLAMVKGVMPDYIFSLEIFIRNSLLKSDWFKEHYTIEKIYPSDVFDSKGLYLFKKIVPAIN